MLLLTVIKYLWASNRSTIIGYCLVSIALTAIIFYRGHESSEDFNALALVSFLNITFFICGTFLCRQVIYKNFQNGGRYFFAPLPIAPLRMRLYEQASFFLIALLPYILVLPTLLFAVYYAGLWSSAQTVNFLGFQVFFWIVFATFALCLAMTGRLCWYLYSGAVIACNLYTHYNGSHTLLFLNFFDVDKILYKSEAINSGLIVNYGGLCVILYAIALALSYSANKSGFAWLHAKETSLSGGLFGLFLVFALIGNFYFTNKLDASEAEFNGLHLSKLGGPDKAKGSANSRQQPDSFWSSSIPLKDTEIAVYQQAISQLHGDVLMFADTYQLRLPAIHYQNKPGQYSVKPLKIHADGDNALEIEFDFKQLQAHFADTERDILVENLINLSRGWLLKENQFIFLRGLSAHWSRRHLDKALSHKRLTALTKSPVFNKHYAARAWLSLYQDSGSCLFDTLAANTIDGISATLPKDEWIAHLQTGLNLDNSWVPFHLFRSLFKWSANVENRASVWVLPELASRPYQVTTTASQSEPVSYELASTEIFPKVFQPTYSIHYPGSGYSDVQVHIYEHQTPGRLVDLLTMESEILALNKAVYTAQSLMLEKDKFSTTLSWYDKDLDCRVNLPWRYVEL
jgi:hypothetical protein